MRRTQQAGGPKTHVLLLAAPAAQSYYPHTGFTNVGNAWLLKPDEHIR
jgi:hypothetical protein